MMNNILKINNDKCNGCGMCAAVCPKDCVTLLLDKEGFYKPKIQEKKCIECGICMQFCIKFQKIERSDKCKEIYSAKNKDKNILKKSTSGGVSYELMKQCIKEEYYVVGASYDYNKEKTFSKIAKKDKDLSLFFGSKYMPSYSVEELKKIIRNNKQKYAIFGTPCQIFPLWKYAKLNNQQQRFLFVNLFCHGCPSHNLWKKYLEENKSKFETDYFNHIEFRSKINGWHEHSFVFETEKGKYKTSRIKNEFTELFFDLNVLNRACYNCKLRNTLNYTDIRLGDFWGKDYDLDKEGVSAVVINSEKGIKIFDKIKDAFYLKRHLINEVLEAQSYGKIHKENSERRNRILSDLSSSKDLKEIIKDYRKSYTFFKKLKILTIKILKCLPQSWYFVLKQKRIRHKGKV